MVSCTATAQKSSHFSTLRFATTLLPAQDNSASSIPMSRVSCFVVSCGVRLSEVGFSECRKPQVAGSIPVADSIALRKLNRNGSSVAGGISNRLLCHAVLEGSKLTNRGSTILSREAVKSY